MPLQCTWSFMLFLFFFFFSDDLLEDSDSEEHSRSESVTGRLYLIHVIVKTSRDIVLLRLLKKSCQNQ